MKIPKQIDINYIIWALIGLLLIVGIYMNHSTSKEITCNIQVIEEVQGMNFYSSAVATGLVIQKSSKLYLADFNKETTEYLGDYSKILVSKDQCVEGK